MDDTIVPLMSLCVRIVISGVMDTWTACMLEVTGNGGPAGADQPHSFLLLQDAEEHALRLQSQQSVVADS